MDERLNHILNILQEAVGLDSFHLFSWEINEEPSSFGGSDFILSTDWIPSESNIPKEEESLPSGAISIDYSLRHNQIRNIIAAQTISHADPLDSMCSREEFFTAWIEKQTGLRFGTNLTLTNRSNQSLEAVLSYDGYPVSNESHLQLHWDEEGRILVCSLPVLATEQFEDSEFSLSLEEVESTVKNQVTLIRLPVEEENRLADFYAIDEVYITQEGNLLPFNPEAQATRYYSTILSWKEPCQFQYTRQLVQPFRQQLSFEEAYKALREKPDSLTDTDVEEVIKTVCKFLASFVSAESGEWELHRVLKRNGLLEAVCQKSDEIGGPLRRKIIILMKTGTYEIINYLDSIEMTELFEEFSLPKEVQVSQDEAFHSLVPFISLDPVYVYVQSTNCYKLCGLLDSDKAVDAVLGKLKNLSEL